MISDIILDSVEITKNVDDFDSAGLEFYKSLLTSHPNLMSLILGNSEYLTKTFGIDVGSVVFKNNLLTLFLLFKSNDNETDAFNNMVESVDGFSDLLDSLGKLK